MAHHCLQMYYVRLYIIVVIEMWVLYLAYIVSSRHVAKTSGRGRQQVKKGHNIRVRYMYTRELLVRIVFLQMVMGEGGGVGMGRGTCYRPVLVKCPRNYISCMCHIKAAKAIL